MPLLTIPGSFSQIDSNTLLTPISASSQPIKTIAYPNNDVKVLVEIARMDRALEERRLEKRKKRLANSDAGRSGSVTGTPAPGTPGSLGVGGADTDSAQKKPLTKKELKKQENNKASEAQQHAATNTAASLALGRSGPTWLKGSGGSKSWLSSKSTTNTSFAPTPKKDPAVSSKSAAAAPVTTRVGRTFGDFREDGVDGQNIQLRDIIAALELSKKDRLALLKAYGRINSLKD